MALAEKWNISLEQNNQKERRDSRRKSILAPFELSTDRKKESAYEELPDLRPKDQQQQASAVTVVMDHFKSDPI